MKRTVNYVTQAVAIPVYGAYWVSHKAIELSHRAFGRYGGLAFGANLPLLWAGQAGGLLGDAGLDVVKRWSGSHESVWDESPPHTHNQHWYPGGRRNAYLPGLWTGRHGGHHIDFNFF